MLINSGLLTEKKAKRCPIAAMWVNVMHVCDGLQVIIATIATHNFSDDNSQIQNWDKVN
jgi:hypothetical protein